MSVRILTLFDIEPLELPVAMVAKKKHASPSHSSESASAKTAKTKESTIATKALSSADEKNYYSIGEVATKFKVRTSHIRFWTVQFGMKVRTTRKGDRLYTPEDIEKLKAIHHLVKDQGFTIAGAKAKLKEAKNTNTALPQNSAIIQAAQNLKATLISLRKQIAQL
jgi:DNA-binding transcriptional MerR regulator